MGKRTDLDVGALRDALPAIEELRKAKAIPAAATSMGPPRPASKPEPSASAWRELKEAYERREREKMQPPEWRADFRPSLAVGLGFPARAKELTPGDLTSRQREVMDLALSKLRRGELVVISGEPGQGKTSMAHLIARSLGVRTMYIRASDLFAAWKSWFNCEHQDHNKRLLRTCPFLVIDDPQNVQRKIDGGGLGLSEVESECLRWVVDHRYGERLPTLILTNATGKGFEMWAGSQIADRVLDGAFITCDWGSFRGGEK